jgi:Rrf2 family transcriptional regulator, nitric oxide-sensitive transcriptional repressor
MRLTTFTDYSLRVLIFLGARPEHRATIAEVATAFGISENHLVKVAHFLGKEGLLENTRGHGGGMRLATAPERINLAEVVRRTEGGDLPAECFDPEHNRCVISGGCKLRGVFHEAVNAFYAVLARYTLADLVRNRSALAKILFPASGMY